MDFDVPADHKVTFKENEKRDKHPNFVREFKKSWNMKVTILLIVIVAFGTVTEELLKALEDFETRGTSGDHPNYNIIENEDLTSAAITQTPMKCKHLILM